MWHGFGDADRYRHKDEILAGHCAAVGRDPDEITRVWAVRGGSIGDADALARRRRHAPDVSVGGDGHGYDLLRCARSWHGATGSNQVTHRYTWPPWPRALLRSPPTRLEGD